MTKGGYHPSLSESSSYEPRNKIRLQKDPSTSRHLLDEVAQIQLLHRYELLPGTTMATDRRHTVDESTLGVTSVFSKTRDHAVLDHVADQDEEVLTALGYKQEFKRFTPHTYTRSVF